MARREVTIKVKIDCSEAIDQLKKLINMLEHVKQQEPVKE